MNGYFFFYCRAYFWYDTNGKKPKQSLRISAIALLSGLPVFNIISLIFIWALINKHTPIKPLFGLILFGVLYVVNLVVISSEKSDTLIKQFSELNSASRRRINISFYCYVILTLTFFVVMLAYGAYFKNKYGNFDELN